VDETGTRRYEGRLQRTWRPEGLDQIRLDASVNRRSTIDGQLIDQELQIGRLEIRTHIRDEFNIAPIFKKEQLFESWEIIDDVFIPAGDYSFSSIQGELSSSQSRPINASITFSSGDFFTGKRTDLGGSIGWRPSPHFNMEASYESNSIDLAEGDFTVDVVQVRYNVIFSSNLVWNISNQWDSESQRFGINSRIRWTVKPGSDLFLVVNEEMDTSLESWRKLKSDISAKIAWTFRY